MNTTKTVSLKDLNPIICFGQHVFDFHGALQKLLMSKMGNEGRFLLALPHISGDAVNDRLNADYILSNDSENKYESLSQLTGARKDLAVKKLNETLAKIESIVAEYKNSKDQANAKYGVALEKSVEVPSEDYIFFDGQYISLTAWGFYIGNNPEQNKFRISRYVKGFVYATTPELTPEVAEETPVPEPLQDTVVEPLVVVPPPSTPQVETKKKRKWWIWLLWILLGLFIIAMIILLVRQCDRDPSADKYLPEKPGVFPPVDTTKIITPPEDTLKGKIVGNRLVVIIFQKGAKPLSVNDFVLKYKELFPGDEYIIAGYDTLSVKQVVLEFPMDKRLEVKQKLEDNIDGIYVLDEQVYSSGNMPSDPGLSNPQYAWGLDAINVFDAWKTTTGTKDIIIAVLDDGFDVQNQELKGKIIKPFNANSGASSVSTQNGVLKHGTHVSAIATGISNSSGVCGVAPECYLMPVQITDANGIITTSGIIRGLIYAIENDADVINMSFGSQANATISLFPIDYQESLIDMMDSREVMAWTELFAYAEENNVTLVQAAGNDNVVIGFDAMSRTNKTIIVSAIGPELTRADFSNYGKRSTISAPGVAIYSAVPGNKFESWDGTSMAAPMVTGAVALIKSVYPNMTNQEISDLLVSTAAPIQNSNKHIGDLLNLSFLADTLGLEKCIDIDKRIQELEEEIERLRELCGRDTSTYLVIPEDPKDCKFATGKWKSSTDLINSVNSEPIMLYFDFADNCTGEITFVERNGAKFIAPLTIEIKADKMIFTMTAEAVSQTSNTEYQRYRFEAIPESHTREASCIAKSLTNSGNIVGFKLFKRN